MPSPESIDITEAPETASATRVVHRIDPLTDPRWDDFTCRHKQSSVFHSSAWLQALCRTYGYVPIVYTTSSAGQDLQNGVVFCRVESWLTGRRLVSLPFSDHCEPLLETDEDLAAISADIEQEVRRDKWRYMEVRPLHNFQIFTALRHTSVSYSFHELDLGPDLNALFRNFHKSSIQRKILRAEREGLKYCEGSTQELLGQFYRLFKITRKRHQLPPQPRRWFVNLIECFGAALKIRVAFKGNRAVAAMLTIRHKGTLVYKYGCSDSRYNNLGGVPFLFWRAIQEAKNAGLRSFDFGRTDAGQQGLIAFKNRWGATESILTYSRYAVSETSTHALELPPSRWTSRAAKSLLGHLPTSVLSVAGRLLYQHIG